MSETAMCGVHIDDAIQAVAGDAAQFCDSLRVHLLASFGDGSGKSDRIVLAVDLLRQALQGEATVALRSR
jgi:hypothetical protein